MRNEKVKYVELLVLIKIGLLVFPEEITVNKKRRYMVAKSRGRNPNEVDIHISSRKARHRKPKKVETKITTIIFKMISTLI